MGKDRPEECDDECISAMSRYAIVMIGSLSNNYGKIKNRTDTSFAHKSFENSPSVLKFLLKLLFSIIKLH